MFPKAPVSAQIRAVFVKGASFSDPSTTKGSGTPRFTNLVRTKHVFLNDRYVTLNDTSLTARLIQQMSPLKRVWRGRKSSGIVEGVQGLGMLQHLRDSRLIPYRLGCNCLYEHPGLKRLLTGRRGR